jgi:hypothetical protein
VLRKVNVILELVSEKNNQTTLIDLSNNLIEKFNSQNLREMIAEHNLTESGKHV